MSTPLPIELKKLDLSQSHKFQGVLAAVGSKLPQTLEYNISIRSNKPATPADILITGEEITEKSK